MAADLMNAEPVFRQWMEIGDRIVKNAQGFSPLDIIHDREKSLSDPFDHMEHSHPALFMTQFAAAKLLQAKGLRPDLLLGVSLGEFVAMSIAGVVPFEVALKALARQPAVFRKSAPTGALIAMLAPESSCEQSAVLRETTQIAGVNASRHTILACLSADADRVIDELRRLDIAFQRLPVPFAFHSQWVEAAKEAYLDALADVQFDTAFWPVWSCCLGRPVNEVDANFLWQIVREPMHVRRTFAALEERGGAHYIDLSPTGTIASILRQELGDQTTSIVSPLMSPFGGNMKRLDELVSA